MGPLTKMSLLVMMMYAASQVSCSLNSYKILGGCMKSYLSSDGVHYGEPKSGASHGIYYKWGRDCRDVGVDPNIAEIMVGRMYAGHYYYQYLVVSTRDDPDEEHYEFRGSYLEVRIGRIVEDIRFKNGITHAEPPMVDITVFYGDVWSENVWRWGYLHFIMEPGVTRAPLADAFSYIPVWKDNLSVKEDERFVGDWSSTSLRQQVSDFRCFSHSWGVDNTICKQYIWKAKTLVVNYAYNTSSVLFLEETYQTLDGIILENFGHGVSSDSMPRIGATETIVTQSRAQFTTNFSVDAELSLYASASASASTSASVSAKVRARAGILIAAGRVRAKAEANVKTSASASGRVDAYVGTSFEFKSDITNTETVTSSRDITWPHECPPGIRKTVALVEKNENLVVPVEFTLERLGSSWTETKDLAVSLSSIVVQNEECCLYETAHQDCGSEYLPTCDPGSAMPNATIA